MQVVDLIPRVSPYLVDCPSGVQHAAIRAALDRFLHDTEIWQDTVTVDASAFDADGVIDVYGQIPADGRGLIRVAELRRVASGDAVAFAMVGTDLHLAYQPQSGAFRMDVVYGPGPTLSEYPAVLQTYDAGIADLAIFLICSVPRRPYYSLQQARDAYARYEVVREQAKHAVVTGHGPGELMNPIPEYF